MSKFFVGSICVTDINTMGKQQHSAFTKANNGKIYAKIQIWVNDTEDQFGNSVQIKLNPKKDSQDERPYIGNAKEFKINNTVNPDDLEEPNIPESNENPF